MIIWVLVLVPSSYTLSGQLFMKLSDFKELIIVFCHALQISFWDYRNKVRFVFIPTPNLVTVLFLILWLLFIFLFVYLIINPILFDELFLISADLQLFLFCEVHQFHAILKFVFLFARFSLFIICSQLNLSFHLSLSKQLFLYSGTKAMHLLDFEFHFSKDFF